MPLLRASTTGSQLTSLTRRRNSNSSSKAVLRDVADGRPYTPVRSLADKAQQLSAEFNLPRKAAIGTVVAHVAAELLMVDELDGRSLSSQIDSLYCTTAPS